MDKAETKEALIINLIEKVDTFGLEIRSYRESHRKYGYEEDELTEIEARVIHIIGSNSYISMQKIANELSRTKSTTSAMVNNLTQKGFITKKKSETDSRRIHHSLTEKGQKVFDYHAIAIGEYYKYISNKLSKFSNKDFEKAISLIEEVNKYWK